MLELTDDDDQVVEDVLKVEEDVPPPSTSGADNVLSQCPFCRRSLTNLDPLVSFPLPIHRLLVVSHVSLSHQDIQSHVNDCCDSAQVSKCEELADANAFSVLMSSRKANDAWEEAEMADDRSFRPTKANGGRRKAPFYKVMQGMPIAVDAFCYGVIPGVTSYFLTYAFDR